MNIVFMGTAELSCASLEALAGQPGLSIAGVVTQPDKPKGRELKLQPPPVKLLAEKLKLPVRQPARARDEGFIAELRGWTPDLIVVIAYGHLLPPAILELPRQGCLNLHASLLPAYRGAAPIQWAIANGETETGVTIMKMDAGLDTGPILAQCRAAILPEDDSASLHDRLARLGAALLVETIPGYLEGRIQPRPQSAAGVSLAPKIKREDGRIEWAAPARTIWNRLRAFTPWPGAFTFSRSTGAWPAKDAHGGAPPGAHLLKIWRAEVLEQSAGAPGEILSADRNGIVVGCGKGALRVLELQREGGRRINAAGFLSGHPLRAGEILGAL